MSTFSPTVTTRTRFAASRTPYVRRGERLLHRGIDRMPDPDFALDRDPDFWEKIEGNASIRAARDFRRHLVAGPRVKLEARTPLQAALVPVAEALLERVKGFAVSRFGLADASVRGRVTGRMHGHWEEVDLLGDGESRRWYLLDKIRIQNKGRWELKRWRDEVDGRTRWGWAVWDFGEIAGGDDPPGWRIPKNPDWYIHHCYGVTDQDIYGRDMARALYWIAHAEHVLWETGLDTAERFGSPWIRGKLKQEVAGQNPGTGSDIDSFGTAANAVLRILKKLRAHNIMVGDERLLDVDLMEAGLRGADLIDRLIERLQMMARILLLGSNLPTSATQGGSFSLAQIQDESTRRLIRFDRELEAETLTDQMLARLLAWNRPALSTMPHPDAPGLTLADVGTPRLLIVDDDVDDPNLREFQLRFLQAVPLKVAQEDLYAIARLSMPAEDDENAITVAKSAGGPPGGLFGEHSPAWLEYADGKLTG